MEEKTKEQLEKEQKEKKALKAQKTKHFFKIFGFSLLGVFGVAVLAVLGTWITGGFNADPIAVTSLTVETGECTDKTTSGLYVSGNEVLIMGDKSYTTKISFEPENANQLKLSVKVKEGKNLLKNVPTSVDAGKPFTLEFATDEDGDVLGGKIELQFTNSNGMISTYLKILVDKTLTEDMLTLSSVNFSPVAGEQNKYSLAVSNNTSNLQLKSNVVNAYASKPGFVEFADQFISSLNFKKSYIFMSNSSSLALQGDFVNNFNNGSRTFGILPANATQNVKLTTYTHKTFIMQNAFTESWLNDIVNGNTNLVDLVAFNQFVLDYMEYINITEQSEEFFTNNTNDEGVIELEEEDLLECLNYIFVVKDADFIVSNIKIQDISIKGGTLNLPVFNEYNYNTATISVNPDGVNDSSYFGIQLISEGNNATDNEILKNSLKDLLIAPYVKYLSGPNDDYSSESKVEVNGISYPKYITDGTQNYVYNDEYVKVIKNVSGTGEVTWQIKSVLPNDENNTPVYLGIIIYNINPAGEIEAKIAKQQVKVSYTKASVGFKTATYNIALNEGELVNASNISRSELNLTKANDFNISVNDFNNMEYKKLLWFVPATDENKRVLKVLNAKDYLEFADETNNLVYLCDINGNEITYDGKNNTYYLVGEGENITLNALNASDEQIKLYVMVMQTSEANGQGNFIYEETQNENNKSIFNYKVVTYSEQPANITITKYLDKIYTYYKKDDKFILCNGADNALVINTDGSGELYVSGCLLNEDGNPVDKDGAPVDEDEIKNNQTALKNYFSAFEQVVYSVDDTNKLKTVISSYEDGKNYITVTVTANSTECNVNFTVYTSPIAGTDASNTQLPYVNNDEKQISLIVIKAPEPTE